MEFKDYYQILGVEPEAETKDIKTAYRRLARKYHPDLNPDKGAEDSFKDVAEAWEVLKDGGRRAEYDELRRYGGRQEQPFEPPPGWRDASAGGRSGGFSGGSGDFSDFFNSVFGESFGSEGGARGRGYGIRGQDVEIELPVFLEDTLTDSSKPVSYQIPIVENGQARPLNKSLKVTVPAGIGDGERIRLKGQGAPGHGEAAAGDLYLHIRLVPHPLFDVEGHNLLITVPIAPWEAALGAKITVPTLSGKINLTIAPGSQSGQKLRVKAKGLLNKRGQSGDLFAVLKVVMPPNDGPDVKSLWQELADKAAFDPRGDWGK